MCVCMCVQYVYIVANIKILGIMLIGQLIKGSKEKSLTHY